MKRFTFRLDRVLELREAAERLQAGILGKANQAKAEAERESEASASQLEIVRDQAGQTGDIPTAAGLRNAIGMTMQAAQAQVELNEAALLEAQQQHAEEMARFAEARMARRTIERLKEQRTADWVEAANRAEQGDIDEIAQRHPSRGGPPK